MNKNLYFDILDKKRKKLLPLFSQFKDRFYLAGGTGLALQLGHRDSIDFDFFTDKDFSSEDLLREAKNAFKEYKIDLVQAGNKTLNIIIADDIKASFFCIKERLLKPTIKTDYLNLADVSDIACMKIVALLRAEIKDYVDLYFILKQESLEEIFKNCKKKYDDFDEMVYLKALISFEDINITKIIYERGKSVEINVIKRDIEKKVKEYLKEKRR